MTDRKRQQHIQSTVLDVATTAAVGLFVWRDPGWINPWQLDACQWIIGGLFIRAAITFYDHLVVLLVDTVFQSKLLPTRTTAKPVRYVSLDQTSIIFLTINAVHEWVFVQRFCFFIWHSPVVSLDPQDIGLLNTIGALYVMFVTLDLCYAPVHHILHMPALYPLIHKHHHRQHFPTRGYLDAGNEHPIEHVIGILSTWGATFGALNTTGAHGVTLFFFFNIHAALAMLNHSPYNVEFTVIPGLFKYSVANHEMHHRKFTINYAQYCLWYDHLMKTFAPYEGPLKSKLLRFKRKDCYFRSMLSALTQRKLTCLRSMHAFVTAFERYDLAISSCRATPKCTK
jgi:sterol desaturase/sphingolipid hydroxylase (fatty acid hydroxylase superfamily)